MQMTPHYKLAVVLKPAEWPAVAASLNRDLARIQEWCNHWCIILNPNKTKVYSLVDPGLRALPMVTWSCLWCVCIWASPNLDILGLKFDSKLTFEDDVRCIVSHVSQRIDILRFLSTNLFLWTPLLLRCDSNLFSQSLSIVHQWRGQLLKVTFRFFERQVYSVIRLCPNQSSCRCAINVVWLGVECCTTLMWTLSVQRAFICFY